MTNVLETEKDCVADTFKAAKIETTQKGGYGLFLAAFVLWSTGIGILTFNHLFKPVGGTPEDTISGILDFTALGLTLFGNRTYAVATALGLAANGVQQIPYFEKHNIGIIVNYAVFTVATVPAILERWVKPWADNYLTANNVSLDIRQLPARARSILQKLPSSFDEKRSPANLGSLIRLPKDAFMIACAKGRLTGSTVQSLCHIPTALAAWYAHDFALTAAMCCIMAGNMADGLTPARQSRKKPHPKPDLSL